MCYRPIKITNKCKVHVPGITPRYLYVPCGRCSACRKRRSDDLFVRSYFEYLYTKSVHGFAQMFTLTYSDDCLPFCTSRHIPCFSREDITLFLKRLRQRLVRYYRISKSDLRYSLVSEYGGLFQRPHYHVVFFINNPNVVPAVFKKLVRESWQRGFINTTAVNDGVICNSSGLRYVCKYVSKDVVTLDFFSSQVEYLRKNCPDEVEVLKKHMPFNRRSIYFGDFGLSNHCGCRITSHNLDTRQVSLALDGTSLVHFALPLHYVRRMLYNSYIEKYYNFKTRSNEYRVRYFLNKQGLSRYMERMDTVGKMLLDSFKVSVASVCDDCAAFVSSRSGVKYNRQSLVDEVLSKSDGLSSDFMKFVQYVAPFYDLKDVLYQEYGKCDCDIGFGSLLDSYSSSLALKEEYYLDCFGLSDDSPVYINDRYNLELSYEKYLASLSCLLNDDSSDFFSALLLLDYILMYNAEVNNRKYLDFEKSALFRKYVYGLNL